MNFMTKNTLMMKGSQSVLITWSHVLLLILTVSPFSEASGIKGSFESAMDLGPTVKYVSRIRRSPVGCSSTCICTSDGGKNVDFTSCDIDPKTSFYNVTDSYRQVINITISYSELSVMPCELSIFKNLANLEITTAKMQSVACDLSNLTHLTSLILHRNRFYHFPRKLSTLPKLTTLDLSSNKLQSLPRDLSNFTHLATLILRYNHLRSFPCELSTIPKLTFLDLSGNYMQSVPCDLSSLTHLTTLYLDFNKLEIFPCNLSTLPKLTNLRILSNQMQTVPCNLSNLKYLSTLYLPFNNMNMFPCELSTLTNLTTLALWRNNIQSVPCDLSNLTRLTTLDLAHNRLKIFPCEVSALAALNKLRLTGNKMTLVPCNLSNLTQLTTLDIDDNSLHSFPCELSSLTKLTNLNLWKNNLMSVSCDLSNLTHLNTLDIHDNSLDTFPCRLSTLTNLTTLELNKNNIQSVPCDLSTLKYLTAFDLSDNSLTIFPCNLSILTNLKTLNLKNNMIRSVPCDLSSMTQLGRFDLGNNYFKKFPCEISTLTKLTSLKLSENILQSIPCYLPNLTHLTTVDLGSNSFSTFPCELSTLTNLTTLKLSSNHIQSIHCDLSTLTYLTTVDLNLNSLDTFPCELVTLSKLSTLILSLNKIQSVHCDLSNLTKLNYLVLKNNALTILDSWPLSLIKVTNAIKIDLDRNAISDFTNDLGASDTLCSNLNLTFLSMRYNKIKHFMDIFKGWNLNISTTEHVFKCIDIFLPIMNENELTCDCIDYEIYKSLQKKKRKYDHMECKQPIQFRGKNPLGISSDQFVCNDYATCPTGCHCMSNAFYRNMTITCTNYEERTLPETLPELANQDYWYCLNFKSGNLKKLSTTGYLQKVKEARFSHNFISEVSIHFLLALEKVFILHVDNNELQRLPVDRAKVKFDNVIDLRLGNNSWVCDCKAMETKLWMDNYTNSIKDLQYLTCHSPQHMVNRHIMNTSVDLFCPVVIPIPIITGTVPVLVIALLSIILLIMFRIRKWRNERRARQRTDLDGDDMKFDVFVSYADEDEGYILDYFIPELERRGFKVCFHRVHFHAGKSIIENISECINYSRRTLVYFSNYFWQSNFCRWEFSEVLNKDIREDTYRLVTIKDPDLDITKLDDSTRSYFHRKTYIERNAVRFWDNLLYSLPQKVVGVEVFEVQED